MLKSKMTFSFSLVMGQRPHVVTANFSIDYPDKELLTNGNTSSVDRVPKIASTFLVWISITTRAS